MNHVALDRAGPHDRHLDDQVVKALRPQTRKHGHLRSRLDLKDPHGVGPREHRIDRRILRGNRMQLQTGDGPVRAWMHVLPPDPARSRFARSIARRMQDSMPSDRQSIFSIPIASTSSLSHSITVRSGIAAFSTGTMFQSGPSVITNPPTCCER